MLPKLIGNISPKPAQKKQRDMKQALSLRIDQLPVTVQRCSGLPERPEQAIGKQQRRPDQVSQRKRGEPQPHPLSPQEDGQRAQSQDIKSKVLGKKLHHKAEEKQPKRVQPRSLHWSVQAGKLQIVDQKQKAGKAEIGKTRDPTDALPPDILRNGQQ